MRSYMHI